MMKGSISDSHTIGQQRVRHWRLTADAKYAAHGVTRVISPSTTVRRVSPHMFRIGVTRVGEVTHLDRNGVPNYVAVRPRDAEPGISYYNGKGATIAQARASAMMEAIERYSGEQCDLSVVVASYRSLRRRHNVVDPKKLTVPRLRDYDASEKLEWVLGFDLLERVPAYVPLNSIVCPYRPSHGGKALFFASTNGLASGNTLTEALSHALCEVNERDAIAIALAELDLRPAVERLLAGFGRVPMEHANGRARYPEIDHRGLPPRAARILGKLRRSGLKVYLRDVTSENKIPTIDCTVAERQPDGTYLAHGGFGSHPDARVALLRSLTEAAQSRVACIQGGREDLPEFAEPRSLHDPDRMFGTTVRVPFDKIRSYQFERVDQDVRFLLRQFRKSGFPQVVAVDLTRPELGVPVVRVVVPQAETWSVFHLHASRGEFGDRVARIVRGDVS